MGEWRRVSKGGGGVGVIVLHDIVACRLGLDNNWLGFSNTLHVHGVNPQRQLVMQRVLRVCGVSGGWGSAQFVSTRIDPTYRNGSCIEAADGGVSRGGWMLVRSTKFINALAAAVTRRDFVFLQASSVVPPIGGRGEG